MAVILSATPPEGSKYVIYGVLLTGMRIFQRAKLVVEQRFTDGKQQRAKSHDRNSARVRGKFFAAKKGTRIAAYLDMGTAEYVAFAKIIDDKEKP